MSQFKNETRHNKFLFGLFVDKVNKRVVAACRDGIYYNKHKRVVTVRQ